LIKELPLTDIEFKSHAALQKRRPPDVDECSWSSCSLSITPRKLLDLNGLPKLKNCKAIARVQLDGSSGLVYQKPNGHIDWWGYKAYDVVGNSSIERVFP
jgi:hypothetical protein